MSTEISALLHDANRLILNSLSIAEISPLQLYLSAITFLLENSVIGNLFEFEDDGPKWISLSPKIDSQGPCVRTLEVEKGGFPPVEFSGDSLKAASISRTAIEILDVSMGQCLQEVE
jgi:hypothetical protein